MSKRKKKPLKPIQCPWCGATFMPINGYRKLCDECRDITLRSKDFNFLTDRDNPENIEEYEKNLRKRYMEHFSDTIVAEGYADRQKEKSLEIAGKVRTEL